MNRYYMPIGKQDDRVIYMKIIIPLRIGGDADEYYDNLYLGAKEEMLKYAFKDNDEVIKDIEKGEYPSLKLEGEDDCLTVTKLVMNDEG